MSDSGGLIEGDSVGVFRLSEPIRQQAVVKARKYFIELDDGTKWVTSTLKPHHSQGEVEEGLRIERWTAATQEYVDNHVDLYDPEARISRRVRVRRICATHIVIDYGEGSNFSMRFGLTTLSCDSTSAAWAGFRLKTADAENLRARYEAPEQQ